jgi:hypothetical protein
MSLSPDNVREILDGMRHNLMHVILPQLENAPYPTGQAVSIYVLLKTIGGYVSPEFRRHILESNGEMRQVLKETRRLFCDRLADSESKAGKFCQGLEEHLQKEGCAEDPFSEYQELMGRLAVLVKAIWGEVDMQQEVIKVLKMKVNKCMRKQLDRELALFA